MGVDISISESRRTGILANMFLGSLVASMNISSLVIALPAILRGIGVNPQSPLGFMAMLWLMFSYPLIVAVAMPIVGRLSDMYGRGRVFTYGSVLFTIMSLLLGLTFGSGALAAWEMIIYRFIQGIGGSMMFSNSSAIITDVYPVHRRGLAMGIVGIAFSAGSVTGLVVGGLLAVINWRLVFLVNVPLGLLTSVWSYLIVYRLPFGVRKVKIDWIGAAMLFTALTTLLLGITFGMMPSGTSMMSWGSPEVIALILIGITLLASLMFIEGRVSEPMLKVDLFKIRPFTFGVLSALFLFLAQGANVFVLSLLLQAIYLPIHGIPYYETPLLAGIYLIPSSVANAIFAPVGGKLVNRLGARVVSTVGAAILAVSFEILTLLPLTSFNYTYFALDIFLMGVGAGLFQSPNLVSIMSAVPPDDRSAASGLRASMQNIGLLMSFALFLSIILIGASSDLSKALYTALVNAGVSASGAAKLTSIPPAYALFAAFLGYDPVKTLIQLTGVNVDPSAYSIITKPSFFPSAIAPAMALGFYASYHIAAMFAILAAILSYLRGREHHIVTQVKAVKLPER